jgi:Flp pilus assembly protein TadG
MALFLDRLLGRWQAFGRANGGNVAVTFGLALIPVFGLAGAALDYSRANSARTAMQAALDSVALMLSKEPGLTQAQMTQKGNDYFRALYNRPDALNVQIASIYNPATSTLTLNGSAVVDTTVSRVLGKTQIPISTSSTVTWGSTKLRISLVLDNTGSMNQFGKIQALKTASHQFLQMMQKAAQNPGDVQVAIVPFTVSVNVGTTYANQPWIDWSQLNGNANGWNGCITDRDQPYDTMNTTPNPANPATLFPPQNGSSCPTELMPLSYDWTALNGKIDQMTANNTTNQTIGLAWGWQALTQGAPLNAPAAADARHVIVLLTDGMNTQNRWSNNQAEIDARTQAACNNIKAASIDLYTILVMSGNSSILQNCASKPSMYFALTQANEIVTTFNQIGTQLSKLRIAR